MAAEAGDPAIRAGRAGDVPAVLRLWEQYGSAISRLAADGDELERLVESMPGALIVADLNDELVGALIATFDGYRGHMHRLAVVEHHRGAGVGRSLVEAGLAHLRARGARRVDAIVGTEEDAASALWSAAGYQTDGAVVRWARNL